MDELARKLSTDFLCTACKSNNKQIMRLSESISMLTNEEQEFFLKNLGYSLSELIATIIKINPEIKEFIDDVCDTLMKDDKRKEDYR